MATNPFTITTNNLSGTNSVQTTLGTTQYVKTVQQDSNGNWVQVVLQLSQGVLVPILQTIFPYGVKPNLYDSVTLQNGQTLGQFQQYGTGTGTGSGTDNTMIIVLLVVGILIFGRSFLKGNKD